MYPLIVLVVTFVLLWVLFILPQQRRVKAHQALVARLAVGDEVMTTSGFYGRIVTLDEADVGLEVAPGVVVRLARNAVARRLDEEQGAAEQATADRPAGTAADRAVEPPGDRER
jgi:preprotein translocase subunit YajC